MRVKAPVFDRQESLHDMRRQFGDIDWLVDNSAVPRNRGPVRREQCNPWRRNRLERFRQRRRDRQPNQYQDEQRQYRRAAAHDPPPTRFTEEQPLGLNGRGIIPRLRIVGKALRIAFIESGKPTVDIRIFVRRGAPEEHCGLYYIDRTVKASVYLINNVNRR